jgi:hypothetical protein
MKKLACFIITFALMARCAQAQPAPASQSGFQLTIELRDGSRVVGKSLEDTLSFHSATLGDMKLSWAGIRSIEYAGANAGVARLTAANGDGFNVQLATETLRVETSFGRSELPVQLIRSIQVSAAGQSGQLSSGLAAWWTGDGNAKDSAGHCDGQVSGGLCYVPGPTGRAFQMDGGDAQVDFGNSAGNFGKGDFTIAFWMKTDSRNPQEAFLGKREACGGMSSFWEIQVGSRVTRQAPTGFLLMQFFDGSQSVPVAEYEDRYEMFSSRPINDGQWHHIAWVRQSANSGSIRYLIYVDGALDNSKAYPEAVNLANQSPVVLGQSVCQCCDGTRPYSGAASELQLFSQALSADQIISIYQAGTSGN